MKFVIEHLSKNFEQKEVLKDIGFTFEEGRIYGLLGRNGAGKTTLFNCLNRDIKADSGSFYLEEDGVRREVAAEDIGYVLSTPTVRSSSPAVSFSNSLWKLTPILFGIPSHWTSTLMK